MKMKNDGIVSQTVQEVSCDVLPFIDEERCLDTAFQFLSAVIETISGSRW